MAEAARTLLIFAHPALERARINPAMADAVRDLPGLTFRDMYEIYPDFTIDVSAEQKLLCKHDLIVLQFPFYWYSAPALLKEWLDLVWLHGFAYGERGTALQGKTLLCALSTGGGQNSYDPGGHNRYSLDDFLRPFEQTALLCGMRWAQPFAIHGAPLMTEQSLGREVKGYRTYLAHLANRCAQRAEA